MKQKQVKTSFKVTKQSKAAKKATPAKKARVEEEESDDEVEVEQKKIVTKKPLVKKAAKVQETVVAESSDEEEQEEDDENEDRDDNEQDEEIAEDGEEASEEEVDEEDEEQEEDVTEDDDDEAPSEVAIAKEEPTIPSQVKSGPIPETVPCNRVIYVTNLPYRCTRMNIIEVFAKYGAIDQLHIQQKSGATSAFIAYKTEKAALAAVADKRYVKVLNTQVRIRIKKVIYNDQERSVHIKNIKNGTTEEELREHFKSCGKIETVKFFIRRNEIEFAFVTFTDKSATPAALKLHGSVLNGLNIRVAKAAKKQNIKNEQPTDERLTIVVKNKQNFENIDVDKLKTIFSKCGEISILDAVCKKNDLAFITFKTKKGVENALTLSGKTEEGIELHLEVYDPVKRQTSIHVSNLPKDCTEEDLTNIFSKAGEIESIVLKIGHAKICFTDCEGYCKSFLYNETFIKGQYIFIEPFSIRKSIAFKPKPFQKRGFKRHPQNGYNVFKPKKAKTF